ncbi:unnamed protein product [Eruca vesicaria subsp. sativa]|uniref:Uncharacterized protein n=1 Tax=Eruca vesicaria subsp. sativa TaxID=29727 RepID=A0ABC8M2H0_ERUVS|nr:unnamed protein product [Eruca vesicaria subsp. sativa]
MTVSSCAVPTTFIYGMNDWMNYQGAVEARKHMKVPCEIIRVPQGGHFVFIDNPSGFHSAVLYACRKHLSEDQDSSHEEQLPDEPINIFQGRYNTNTPPTRLSYHYGNHYNSLVDPHRLTVGGAGLGFSSLTGRHVDGEQMKAAIKAQQEH